MTQKPEKITRNEMKRPLPKTFSMSPKTLPNDAGGGASAGRGGSLKNSSVATSRSSVVPEDITRTYAMPNVSRTGTARNGPTAPPMFTSM